MRDSDLLHVPLPQRLGVPFTLNRASPQARGLVGWWPLDSLPVRDYMRPWNAFTTSSTWSATAVETLGRALDGNAAASGWDAASYSPYLLSGPHSYTWWMRTPATFDTDDVLNRAYNITEIRLESTRLRFLHGDGSSFTGANLSYTFSASTLYHCAITYLGNGLPISLYINGIYQTQATASWEIPASGTWFRIGYRRDLEYPFNGLLRDLRQYNRALSAAEVAALYNPATRWELYQPLVPAWGKAPAAAPAGALLRHPGMTGGMKELAGGMRG